MDTKWQTAIMIQLCLHILEILKATGKKFVITALFTVYKMKQNLVQRTLCVFTDSNKIHWHRIHTANNDDDYISSVS